MTSPVSPSEIIARAMEGVTLNRWAAFTGARGIGIALAEFDGSLKRYADDGKIVEIPTGMPNYANFIAACNPVAMREVLNELYALRETALKLEATQREMADLRAMLERCAPAEQSKSWLPIPLWQAARTLIHGEKK